VATKTLQPWVTPEKIEYFVQIEPALVILGLAITAWLVSQLFLRKVSDERRRTLKTQFHSLGFHLVLGTGLMSIYYGLEQLPYESPWIIKFMIYEGLAVLISGAVIFVKVLRILVFEYLFLSHRKVPFPVLIVNLFTLLVSIAIASWIGAEIFSIQLTPILATSAIFSLVLGLALQDTLGNLFAGVALQFDKPYEIGDWIEIQSGGHKWVGQVDEISWRATVLISMTNETITVPNRVMAQAELANFSTHYRPIVRSIIFRFPFGEDIDQIKSLLLHTAKTVHAVRKTPGPLVLVTDTNESWMAFKLVYQIDNYGEQFLIADKLYSACLEQLNQAGIQLASHRISLDPQCILQQAESDT